MGVGPGDPLRTAVPRLGPASTDHCRRRGRGNRLVSSRRRASRSRGACCPPRTVVRVGASRLVLPLPTREARMLVTGAPFRRGGGGSVETRTVVPSPKPPRSGAPRPHRAPRWRATPARRREGVRESSSCKAFRWAGITAAAAAAAAPAPCVDSRDPARPGRRLRLRTRWPLVGYRLPPPALGARPLLVRSPAHPPPASGTSGEREEKEKERKGGKRGEKNKRRTFRRS